MRLPRPDPFVWLVLAFSVFAVAPLTAPGYFIYGHDARHSVYFLQMFDQSMRDGAWYPRWAADMVFGYGYPLWVILAPLPFFAGEAFHLLGLDFVSAVKLVNGVSILASGLAMYLFVSRAMNRNAGLVAAVAYIYIPYHLVDMYVRAAQAELVAFVFPPLVLWGCHELATTRKLLYIPLTALAYAGLLLTHIQTAVIFTPVIGLYLVLLWLGSPEARLKPSRPAEAHSAAFIRIFGFPLQAFLSIVLALGLAAIFLLPAASERQMLTSAPLIGGAFNYRNHFLNASQLLSPFWGYGYAGESGSDQFSLQLGLLPVLLGLVGLWALSQARGLVRVHIAFFLILTVAVVLAMSPLSASLWEPFSSILAYVQFPWRFLGITTVCLAFLMGAALYSLSGEDEVTNAAAGLVPALAVAVLTAVLNYPYSEPQHTDAVFNYQTQMEFETKYGELLGDTIWIDESQRPTGSPLVAQYVNGEPLEKAIALDEGTTVRTIRHGGQSDDIEVDSSAAAKVLVYTRYFPGWSATIDGQPTGAHPYGPQGLIMVNVPQGKHTLQLRFQDSPVRQAGVIVSSAALVITILALVVAVQSARLPKA